MSYPINYPTPQGANVQIFSQGGTDLIGVPASDSFFLANWVKPQGASFVWFTLIGGGGAGTTSGALGYSGGSAAVTNFMCPAFLIPDVLQVKVGRGGLTNGFITDFAGLASSVVYQQKDGTGYTLLSANGGLGGYNDPGTGGTAMTANAFTAMGFFQSVAGQDGPGVGVNTVSATTFLAAGSDGSNTSNYGYFNNNGQDGYFLMQPIIVGVGGAGGTNKRAGIGCGGGRAGPQRGGNGMVVIITW